MRLIYLCPADNTPTGGVKVIYRHAERLAALGFDAHVLHPFDTAFRCTWFEHAVSFLDTLALDRESDYVIVPDIWAPIFGPQCALQGVRYAVFVQNGYLTHPLVPGVTPEIYEATYSDADLVLVISDDSGQMTRLNYRRLDPGRVLRVSYSVSPRFTHRLAARQRIVSYMPRKMAGHAARVVAALPGHLAPGWTLQAIDGVDEQTCAVLLHQSSIFLAFSEFEGLPLPPLEAALAGNRVIGYTGQGAQEYWRAPIFTEVHQGDIIGFVRAAGEAAREIDSGQWPQEAAVSLREELTQRYGAEAEDASLSLMAKHISSLIGEARVA